MSEEEVLKQCENLVETLPIKHINSQAIQGLLDLYKQVKEDRDNLLIECGRQIAKIDMLQEKNKMVELYKCDMLPEDTEMVLMHKKDFLRNFEVIPKDKIREVLKLCNKNSKLLYEEEGTYNYFIDEIADKIRSLLEEK